MTTTINLEKEVESENPLFIEGLAGIGHVGRNCVSYMAEHLEAEKIGELRSRHFPPYTMIEDDATVKALVNNIYLLEREDDRDIVLMEGNAQASTTTGHYEIAEKVLDFVERLEAEEMITIGGYGTGEVVEQPEVFGASTSTDTRKKYTDVGIKFDHDVGQIVGISGLLLGLGQKRGLDGTALLGETPGFLMSDPQSTEAVLEVLEKMIDVEIDFSDLDEKAEESQEVLKKLQNLKGNKEPEESQSTDLGYIG